MKLENKTNRTVTVEMTHEQALMIVALARETCFGTVMHDFETRVGHSPKQVGEVAQQLHELLDAFGISE